jgi:uncharacterized protein (TIGR03118 family)
MRHKLSRAGIAGFGISVAAAGLAVAATVPAGASTRAGHAVASPSGASPSATAPDSFGQTNLIANKASYKANLTDPNLTNAWGLAAGPGEPIWVSDNNSGNAGVYGGGIKGSKVTLELTVPVPGGNPTGQVFNPDSAAFHVAGTASIFIVDTDSTGKTQSPGEIAAWNGGATFVVEDSVKGGPGGKVAPHAVFKGLAIAANPKAGPELFATDVADGKIDVFNGAFHPVSTPKEFRDPKIPAGYVPFNVQNLGGRLYVTYGKQNKAKTDVAAGKGLGFVDVYSVDGKLLHHLAAHGALNAPWGLAIAPKGFGPYPGDLLVGNLGNGWINAYNPTTGKYLGWLAYKNGKPVAISGLWGLRVGNSAFGGGSSLIFSAGPAGYGNGLVGILSPAKPTTTAPPW